MNDHEPTIASRTSPQSQPPSQVKWQAVRWLLRALAVVLGRVLVLLLVGFAAFLWSGLSDLALIRFDYTGLDPRAQSFAVPPPIDYTATLANCLGPLGWIVGLGIFGLAFTMALTVYRCRGPLRVIVVAAPLALLGCLTAYTGDTHPWVRTVCLRILIAKALLAVLAAVLCRPIWRLLVAMWRDSDFLSPLGTDQCSPAGCL